MVRENLGAEQGGPRWFIDLDWYEQNGRSFLTLARGCLCPRCRERLGAGEISAAQLVANVRDCCSKLPGFITGELAILAIIFRLFLAGGNQPLNLAELSEMLIGYLRLGPPTARVTKVITNWSEYTGSYSGFRIRY